MGLIDGIKALFRAFYQGCSALEKAAKAANNSLDGDELQETLTGILKTVSSSAKALEETVSTSSDAYQKWLAEEVQEAKASKLLDEERMRILEAEIKAKMEENTKK